MMMSNTLPLCSSQKRRDDYFPPSPPLSTTATTTTTTTDVKHKQLDLDKLIQTYGKQPELLELILSSKVEEDRRLAEEAKLKRKEIDYMLHRRQSYSLQQTQPHYHPYACRKTSAPPSLLPSLTHATAATTTVTSSSSSSSSSTTTTHSNNSSEATSSSALLPPIQPPSHYFKRPSYGTNSHPTMDMLLTRPSSPPTPRLPAISTLNTTAMNGKPTLTTTESSPRFMNQSIIHAPSTTSRPPTLLHPRSHLNVTENLVSAGHPPPPPPAPPSYHPLPTSRYPNAGGGKKPPMKRQRREMQAISTILETREFPYNDDYLWKNNGNTVHKKTGFKSIYYKCSNSIKGCSVNKTVTFKENGQYLIKYRGQHLPECHRIKRISDL
ncbi:hypothetical protein BDF20DRAFT_1001774 [Mycotypha africana]|uniref:uncharacterized protein n=1 Tax=Mycotypha africana TaxID=64632 RepID=UPI0023007707|nr:uncharacterized protein BDF20DRAFT_1001774 [Mycotypha africana]KAI8975217.1 hypothetical protein BDF20DRAFT_1001774 [Mycotypha africana]